MRELRHILSGVLDSSRLTELADYFDGQAREVRMMADGARASLERSAELAQRLAAWRASQQPARSARDIEIMRLARRGLSDDEIGKSVSPRCSGRTVRRVIKAELRR
jgi:hypothetical protein